MIIITTKTNQETLRLLVFENDWCAQCYTERPIVAAIKQSYADRLNLEIVNVDRNPKLVEQHQIRSAPSIVLIKNQQVVEKIPRFMDKEQLQAVINYYL